jgi:protein gp37
MFFSQFQIFFKKMSLKKLMCPQKVRHYLEALPNLNLQGVDWVIVGGESGHQARPMNPDWFLDIQEQCEESKVAFFFKQWGGKNKKKAGRELNGQTYDEMPIRDLKRFI